MKKKIFKASIEEWKVKKISNVQKSFFKEWKNTYDEVWKKTIQLIKKHLTPKERIKVLDIGCHNGSFLINLRAQYNLKNCELYGVDIDSKLLSIAKQKGIITLKHDANYKFPFPNDFFDIIIASQLIEHLINPDNLLLEASRMLKPDGMFLLSLPNLCAFHNRILILLGMQPTTLPCSTKVILGNPMRGLKPIDHIRGFSPAGIKEMIRYYGFEVVEYVGIGYYFIPKLVNAILSKVFPGLAVILIFLLKRARS